MTPSDDVLEDLAGAAGLSLTEIRICLAELVDAFERLPKPTQSAILALGRSQRCP